MLTGGTNERNKIVVLGFPDGSPQPGVVLKLARSSISEPGLVREARVLGAIHQSPLATVVDIPQVAFSGRIGGALAVAETAVHGQPISTRLTEGTFAATTLEMATTLGSAVREVAAVPAGEWFDRLVSPVAADFRRHFDGMVSAPSVERQLRALRSLPPLPLVVEHRDCSPWNVLRTPQGRLALLDWESSEPSGLPFLDLMYFAVNAAFLVEGALGSGREGETYGRIIGSSTLNSAVSAAVEEYCTVGRLPLDAARPLATFAWMLHACTEHERLVADDVAAGGVGSGAEANSTFLTLWRMDTGQAGAASSRPDPEA